MRLQCVYYGSHTCVVITLLTQEALDRIYVAGDTGLSRILLLAAVFSMWSASTKTLDTRGDGMRF